MYFKFSHEKSKIKKNNYEDLNILIKILQESNKIDSENLKLDFDELKRIWTMHEVEFLYGKPMLPSLGKMLYAIEELIENLNPYASNTLFKSMQIIRLFGLIDIFSNQYDKSLKDNYDVLNEIKRITELPVTNKG